MAIEKMKKLRLMAIRSNKDALLRELICRGCVEFSELEGELQDSQFKNLVARESSGLLSFKTQHTALVNAVDVLDKYAPAKKPLLSAKPEVGENVLLDDSGLAAAAAVAERVSANEDRIKRIGAEESRQNSNIDALEPWAALKLPLETTGTQRCSVVLGTVPGSMDLAAMEAALAEVTEEAELFLVDEDKAQKYLLLVCIKEEHSAVMDCMRAFSFAIAPVSGMNGTARECIAAAENELKKLADEKRQCTENIVALAVHRDELKLAADVLSTKIARAEAEDKLYGLKSVVFMQGWMPAERESEMAELFDKYDCAWETEDPEPSEYPEVPVKLRSNKVTNALNMVTNMYSLPAYDGLDPNPLMAPFFILFYGLMMADMGYGLLMVIAALVALKKIKPREGSLSFCQLLLYCGIATFAMGALTGGFFGDALEQIGKIIGMPEGWGVLPSRYICSRRLDGSRTYPPEHRHGHKLRQENEARPACGRHLGGGRAVGNACRHRPVHSQEGKRRGRSGRSHRRSCHGVLRRQPQRQGCRRQDTERFRNALQSGHRLVRRYSVLLAYHGADARRLRHCDGL